MAGLPKFVIDFPALLVSHDWVEQHCVVPDGFDKGEPFLLAEWQAWCLLNFYRVKPNAKVGQLATAFHFRRGQVVLPQKAGKAPYTAAHICLEGVGPALFAGWAKGGETWDCRDHGCGCGWVYEYLPGEAMGMPWPTPLIQITAFSDDQTDNIYRALRPMIDTGPLTELIPKTGEEFIRLPNDGRIDTVTSSARSRLGARVTFVPQDETGIWTPQSGMIKVAETQRRGLAGMGGRAEETSNGWDPTEGSTAQRTAEARAKDIFRYHPLPPKGLKYTVKADRRKIHRHVYDGCPWVDLDAIEAEAAELLETDPGQAQRFFGNDIVAGAERAFDLDHFKTLAALERMIEPGRIVTGGFDGSLTNDATGLVVTDVETGHQCVVAWWQRPVHLQEDADWQVPIDEVNEAVDFMFGTWDVWRLYGDPPHYRDDMNRWAGLYGADRVVEWWTNDRKKTAQALREFKTDMGSAEKAAKMSHGPLRLGDTEPDADAFAAHVALVDHVGNAVRRPTNMRDEADGVFLWLIGKESAKSSRKIDLAMCAFLSWTARGHAVRAGVLKTESFARVQWNGQAKTVSVDRSGYLPCKGCEKPIHPRLHAPDAQERGRCLGCRVKAGGVTSARW